MKQFIFIIVIIISCMSFLISGIFIGFYKGQQYTLIQSSNSNETNNVSKTYDSCALYSKPIIGAPIKSRRQIFKNKLLNNKREISQDARERIEKIVSETIGNNTDIHDEY